MKYLACADDALDPATGICSQEVWVDAPTWVDYMPTYEQGNAVGMAIFGAVFILYAMKRLLMSPIHPIQE